MAVNEDGMIGSDDPHGLPWSCPEDMAYFRRHTLGQVVFVGRKTYDLIGRLPQRAVYVVDSKDAFLRTIAFPTGWWIGGRHTYEEALKTGRIDYLFITRIPHKGGTVPAPEIDFSQWELTNNTPGRSCRFEVWSRKSEHWYPVIGK